MAYNDLSNAEFGQGLKDIGYDLASNVRKEQLTRALEKVGATKNVDVTLEEKAALEAALSPAQSKKWDSWKAANRDAIGSDKLILSVDNVKKLQEDAPEVFAVFARKLDELRRAAKSPLDHAATRGTGTARGV